jgi:hydrogenase maturation protease
MSTRRGDDAQARASRPISLLVLGLGNVLLGDDGLGAAALARLERGYRIPPGVFLEEGGTLGLSLLGLIADAENVILVDAVRTDSAPGTLVRIDGDEVVDAVRDRLSPHQVGVADLLDAATMIGCYPASVTLLGLVPEVIELGVGLTSAVEAGLDQLVAAIVREIQGFGYEMLPDVESEARHSSIRDLAYHFGM